MGGRRRWTHEDAPTTDRFKENLVISLRFTAFRVLPPHRLLTPRQVLKLFYVFIFVFACTGPFKFYASFDYIVLDSPSRSVLWLCNIWSYLLPEIKAWYRPKNTSYPHDLFSLLILPATSIKRDKSADLIKTLSESPPAKQKLSTNNFPIFRDQLLFAKSICSRWLTT